MAYVLLYFVGFGHSSILSMDLEIQTYTILVGQIDYSYFFNFTDKPLLLLEPLSYVIVYTLDKPNGMIHDSVVSKDIHVHFK